MRKSIRLFVRQRANGCCEYCCSQARFSPDPFSVEHIIAKTKGGSNDPENLAFACQGCNNHKYAHTDSFDPVTQQIVQLFNPRRQNWKDHFSWDATQTQILPKTATGRVTIEKLHLNREELVDFRRILVLVGEHPPVGR